MAVTLPKLYRISVSKMHSATPTNLKHSYYSWQSYHISLVHLLSILTDDFSYFTSFKTSPTPSFLSILMTLLKLEATSRQPLWILPLHLPTYQLPHSYSVVFHLWTHSPCTCIKLTPLSELSVFCLLEDMKPAIHSPFFCIIKLCSLLGFSLFVQRWS